MRLVAPRVGAWIETDISEVLAKAVNESHPVWVRGLKLAISDERKLVNPVAPRVGAWIETLPRMQGETCLLRRTPCGCVD